MLDTIDGDADLEPSLGVEGNDDDREENGDELDWSCADDLPGTRLLNGGPSSRPAARVAKRRLSKLIARRA